MSQNLELHLTVAALAESELPRFLETCAKLGATPILVELSRGAQTQQPMATWHVDGQLWSAANTAREMSKCMAEEGYFVVRTKIEADFDKAKSYENDQVASLYYEWHAKLPSELESHVRPLCEAHGAHLSRNALRGQDFRFVTIRETLSADEFKNRISMFSAEVTARGWAFANERSEICLADDNCSLDAGWLSEQLPAEQDI